MSKAIQPNNGEKQSSTAQVADPVVAPTPLEPARVKEEIKAGQSHSKEELPVDTFVEPTVASLSSEIATLKAQWAKENSGLMGWVKKWGAIVGLAAGIIAVPKAAFDLYMALVTRPETSVQRGPDLEIAYDPTEQKIILKFSFSILNSGTADDTINELWATLAPPAPASSVSFDTSKISGL